MEKNKCEYEDRCAWSNYGTYCQYTFENSKPIEECIHWMRYRLEDIEERLGSETLSRLLEPKVENKDGG